MYFLGRGGAPDEGSRGSKISEGARVPRRPVDLNASTVMTPRRVESQAFEFVGILVASTLGVGWVSLFAALEQVLHQ